MGRTLFIDEELEFLEAIEQEISKLEPKDSYGYFSDPDAALREIRDRDVNVLITDLDMPHHRGTDLIKRVKEFSPVTKCMMLTAHTLSFEEKDYVNHNGIKVIDKKLGISFAVREVIKDEFNYIKEELIQKLNAIKNQNSSIWISPSQNISIKDLIGEIISESDIGLKYIELFRKYKEL